MKTLKIIQTLAKIVQIVSKIVFICCIVGASGCVLGIISLACGLEGIKIGGVTLKNIIQNEAGYSVGTLYTQMAASVFLCAGEGVSAKFAEVCFKRELERGTPFDLNFARETFRLGIITICVPLGALVLAEITQGIMSHALEDVQALNLDGSSSFGGGIAIIIISLLCRLGAEQSLLNGEKSEKNQELEQNEKTNNA